MDVNKIKQRDQLLKWHNMFVLISCCFAMAVDVGFIYSFGTIFSDIMVTFNSTRAETSVIQSALISVLMLSGLITGIFIKKFGFVNIGCVGSLVFSLSLMSSYFASSLIFIVISSVFSGIGLSCVYICINDVINCHFYGKRKLLYMSILVTSSGIGGTSFPYFIRYLSDLYGWRSALFLIGAITLNVTPICLLWKQYSNPTVDLDRQSNKTRIAEFQIRMEVKTEINEDAISIEKTNGTQHSDSIFVLQFPVLKGNTSTKAVTVKDSSKNMSNKCTINSSIGNHIISLLSNQCFMLVVFGTILSIPSLNFILIFIGDIYFDNGLTHDDLSFGLVLLNILSIVGRLLVGIVLQSKFVSSLLVPLLCSVFSAVLFILLTFVKSRVFVIALTTIFGVPMGIFASLLSILTLELVDSNLLPIAIGIAFTLNGISNLIMGPVNGFIRDITGSYQVLLYGGMAINILAAIVFFLAYILRRTQRKGKRRQSTIFYLTSL